MNETAEMSFTELKSWLRDRFQSDPESLPDLNQQIDESPFEAPLKLWQEQGFPAQRPQAGRDRLGCGESTDVVDT
jgi:hypothetical protein